jgi:hypothetical protein
VRPYNVWVIGRRNGHGKTSYAGPERLDKSDFFGAGGTKWWRGSLISERREAVCIFRQTQAAGITARLSLNPHR